MPFHFSQAILRSASMLGLRTNILIKTTKTLIFNLKLLCFVPIGETNDKFLNI